MQSKPTLLHRILRNVILILLTVISTLLALEIGFRVFPQTIPQYVCQSNNVIGFAYCKWYYQFDTPPELGYTLQPGLEFSGSLNTADPMLVQAQDVTCSRDRDDTFSYTFQVDENGFINDSPWQDEYDLVVTGDSFTQPYAPTFWLDLLEDETDMSILNLGMAGWGSRSEISAIRSYGLDKNPEWVVMLYFEGNDIFNIGNYDERYRSGLDWRSYELSKVTFWEKLIAPQVLDFWLGSITGAQRPPQEGECRYPIQVNSNINQFETVYADTLISQLSLSREQIETSPEWESLTAELLALKADVEDQGGNFLLVFVPAKEHIYWGMMWEERDLANFLSATYPSRSFAEYSQTVEAQSRLVEEFAADNEVSFINLTTPFWLAARNEGEVYNYADSHWNSRGNEIAAELIVEYILENR